ncbi:type II toxin-antitoxin system RelE/ParE family toxin, partial [Enterococcus faecalis]
MSYRLEFTPDVKKQLKKMDKYQATLLTRWLYRNIDGTANPREHGKALSANRAGQWRYRIGNYRVIVEIEDERLVVTAI